MKRALLDLRFALTVCTYGGAIIGLMVVVVNSHMTTY